jgi:hypothetical protein
MQQITCGLKTELQLTHDNIPEVVQHQTTIFAGTTMIFTCASALSARVRIEKG